MARVAGRQEFDDEPDWDEDVEARRCRVCRKTFFVKVGQKVRHCPLCGADQTRGTATRPLDDARFVRERWPRRAREL